MSGRASVARRIGRLGRVTEPAAPPTDEQRAAGQLVVTIDGVAASGKSTVARRIARELGVPFVSSGLLYRAATLAALEAGLNLDDEPSVIELLERAGVDLELHPAGNRALIGGRDATDRTHSSLVDVNVSRIARLARVREWVNARLRGLRPPFVAEGRDMGASVFPGAPAKLYLTASPRVRAERRSNERPEEVAAIQAALIERDRLDAAQSRPAPDATIIDTSELDLDEVVRRALELARPRA